MRAAFRRAISRQEAVGQLGLDPDRRYLLLSGGSIGAGQIRQAAAALQGYLARHPEATLITVCGSREPLYDAMQEQYGRHPQMELLRRTDRMAEYMRASDAVISKPGGLSSTETATIGVPLLHISPIPGCETKNAAFFPALA